MNSIMPSIMQSIKPQYCELIANGKKTIELRKTRPKIEPPFKVYMYETKGQFIKSQNGACTKYGYGRGKVIGEYICDRIEYPYYYLAGNKELIEYLEDDEVFEKTQLSYGDFKKYFNVSVGHGYRITDLVIYDKPKELGEFKKPCNKDYDCFLCDKSGYTPDMHIDCFNMLTHPPLSWCYVEELR